jgi:hypothetical protein
MLRRLARRLRGEEDGYALLAVLGIGTVLLILVAASLTVATSGYRKAKTDDDWNAALSAAYGGLEEYRSRVANDSTYVQYGNPSAAFSAASIGTLSLPTGAAKNAAFGIGATGSWATIPGSSSSFRYEVDNSDYSAGGVVHLRVTGRSGGQTRSIVTDLKQTGFLDFLYFTDKETSDPQLRGELNPQANGQPHPCDAYAWAGRPGGCATIQFGAMDTINGPLHSNDQLVICGGTFNGAVTTASTLTPNYTLPSGCGTAAFAVGTGPMPSASIGMPPTNAQMKTETRTDLGIARPGCLYTGPTSITFNGDGTMTVVSPWTKRTQVSATRGTRPAACGRPGMGGLGNPAGATIPVLPSNLVYVQSVPTSSADPNYSATPPGAFSCTGTSDFPGWTFGSLAYPVAGETQPDGTNSVNPAYKCTNGDVYVKGKVSGAITIASENFVYITGDLTYANPQKDILGLVGTNAVQVWNPRTATGLMFTDRDRTVQAAILSTAHTFTVQNFAVAPSRGTLTVLGAIAQKFRGPVATTSGGAIVSGYAKNYTYDSRLRSAAPPKFLTPTSTSYTVGQVADVPAAFTATGGAG